MHCQFWLESLSTADRKLDAWARKLQLHGFSLSPGLSWVPCVCIRVLVRNWCQVSSSLSFYLTLSPELSDLTRLGGQQIPGIVSVSLVLGGVSGTEITSADHHGWLCIWVWGSELRYSCLHGSTLPSSSPAPKCSYPWDILSVYLIPGNPGIVWVFSTKSHHTDHVEMWLTVFSHTFTHM